MIQRTICGKCGGAIEHDRLAILDTPICAKCAADEPGNILNAPTSVPQPRKGMTLTVHNHGFVRLIDWMGSDKDIVEAARVSYHSPSKGDEADKKLLRYLFEHKHTSPFEIVKIKFNIKMPIFVMRQYIRHRMQNVNEVSARYTQLPDDFFIPETWRAQDTKNKQGSVSKDDFGVGDFLFYGTMFQSVSEALVDAYERCYSLYEELLSKGVAREQARIVLPVGVYTEFYCCWDLNNLLKYFALRDDPHAQGEHQDYARAMKQLTAQCFPWTMELYESSRKQ